jgi:hypothetical protein
MAEAFASVGVLWDEDDSYSPLTLMIQSPSGRVTVGLSTEKAEELASVIIQEIIEHTPELH